MDVEFFICRMLSFPDRAVQNPQTIIDELPEKKKEGGECYRGSAKNNCNGDPDRNRSNEVHNKQDQRERCCCDETSQENNGKWI